MGLGVIAPAVARATDNPVDAVVKTMSHEDVQGVADSLGLCGGIYSAFAGFVASRAPALGKQYEQMRNGALLAGAYLLYREHRVRSGEVRPLREFLPQLEGREEVGETTTKAAFEAQDLRKPQQLLEYCHELDDLQTLLIKAARAEMYPE